MEFPPGESNWRAIHKRYSSRGFTLGIDKLKELCQKPCTCCGVVGSNTTNFRGAKTQVSYNSVDRIDNTKGYIEGNIQTLCRMCNQAKSNWPLEVWQNWLTRLVNFQKENPLV